MPHSSRPRRLKPTAMVADLAESDLLDLLSGPQLVVYVRLLAAANTARRFRVQPTNGELYGRDQRTAVRALRELEKLGLIAITYDKTSRPGRSIEVLR